ncbi:MAG: hypothetical protein KF792_25820 [Chelatococcus sp.]|nr:hypothetical protein [Chelatococcus sp. YT9]MBX3559686.1 hypothetical protein [Chelatococcus sp.]
MKRDLEKDQKMAELSPLRRRMIDDMTILNLVAGLNQTVCALRFFYGVTLCHAEIPEWILYAPSACVV